MTSYGGRDGNPGGPGGRRGKIPHNIPQGKTSHRGGGNKPPKKGCCPMVAAIRSVKEGHYNQAYRYTRLAGRSIAKRLKSRTIVWE